MVGSGAVGTSAAYHLGMAGRSVLVLEKEGAPAQHQSGRSSGVIHAGYNLRPGSMKAKLCVQGNRMLRAYCRERGIALRETGIMVLATTEGERSGLEELRRRASENGVRTERLDAAAIAGREPHAAGVEALVAPDGASFDAAGYVRTMADEATKAGARFEFGVRAKDIRDERGGVTVLTDRGPRRAKVAINCAGLHADRVAGSLGEGLRVIPFRGYYAELRPERRSFVRSHIYHVPDLQFPFLGVHLSRRTDGRVLVGPGAMLAFGREAYRFTQWNARDVASMLSWPGFYRMVLRRDVRRLLRAEVAKSLRLAAIAREARRLVPDVRPGDLVRSYAGIRAQLVDRRGELVDDMVLRETERSIHVLNAVSPGLTCSLPFGEDLARRAVGRL